MPDLETGQETELLTPVEEPSPETVASGPALAPASASLTGEVVRRLGETGRVDHALSPPAATPASLLGHPAHAMAANAPQKARLVLDLQQRYGNAYTQQVMTLVQPAPAEPDTVTSEDAAPSDVPATPAAPAVSAAPAMPVALPTRSETPAPPPASEALKPEAPVPMPAAVKPEALSIPAVVEAAPPPLVEPPLATEAPPPS